MKLGDMLPVRIGDVGGVVEDELAEKGDDRMWDNHGPQWIMKEREKDGFVSTLTRIVSILPEGKPLWEGPCQKIVIEEVDVRPIGAKGIEKNDPEDPNE